LYLTYLRAPKKGTKEFEAACEKLLKDFADLREKWKNDHPDNQFGRRPKSSTAGSTDEAHPIPLPVDENSSKFF